MKINFVALVIGTADVPVRASDHPGYISDRVHEHLHERFALVEDAFNATINIVSDNNFKKDGFKTIKKQLLQVVLDEPAAKAGA